MHIMGNVHGRDCSTKVYFKDKKWYLECYAFGQRVLTSEEFVGGEIGHDPEELLKEVILELSSQNE